MAKTKNPTPNGTYQNGLHRPSTEAWKALSLLLPSRSADCDYWWNLTGADLARMVDAAEYPVEKQYEALLFHYHWMVPYMGPAPGSSVSLHWPCVLTLEGLPIEYSWKWNVGNSEPVVRYTIEAKSHLTGSAIDPLNQEASRKMLHRLENAFSGVDLSWTNHFLATLFDHDRFKFAQESKTGVQHTTSIMIAAELKKAGLTLKTYLIPRKIGLSHVPFPLWQEAIAAVCPKSKAAVALYDFLNTDTGRCLSPTMLAVDNVAPEKSRLKFYHQSPKTDFSSTRSIMTLGGRISVPEERLQDLRCLIAAVVGLEPDFPEDEQLPVAEHFNPPVDEASNDKTLVLPGYGYYFDIAPGNDLPEIKIFIRLCVNGPDDLTIAHRLMAWMEERGRGEFCQGYLKMLGSLAHHRRLVEGKGVHTHVSCLFLKNGDLDITSYLVPEVSVQPPMLRQ